MRGVYKGVKFSLCEVISHEREYPQINNKYVAIFILLKYAFDKYSDFKGRAGRTEYWLFVLVNVAISIVYQILVSVSGDSATARLVISAIFGLFYLAILVPGLAISVRRMHDIGKGGEWIFINFIPVIGAIWFLVLCIKEGEPAANRFGEPQP